MGFAAGLLRQDLLIIIDTERAKRAMEKNPQFLTDSSIWWTKKQEK